jgi:hypothetical protein
VRQKIMLKMLSEAPIEIVYGLTNHTLKKLQEISEDISGFDWVERLDEISDQREEFCSGLDASDAILIASSDSMEPAEISFVYEDFADDIENDPERRTAHCIYSSRGAVFAGDELDAAMIDHIVVAQLSLKNREWRASLTVSAPFDPKRLKIKLKYRDADKDPASLIYASWFHDYEESIIAVSYNRRPIQFEVDYTSYPPEFMCLTRKNGTWERNELLERFLER